MTGDGVMELTIINLIFLNHTSHIRSDHIFEDLKKKKK